MRRFVVDFMNGHNATVCREIMDGDYRLRVGDQLICGRDTHYRPAVQAQLDQFPGMGLTVHHLVTSGDQVAMHFTEHGASGGCGGPVAAWQGIALYRWNGSQLTSCAAEEDYFARRRQLKSGAAEAVASPMPAPWDVVAADPNPHHERIVREWLADGGRLEGPPLAQTSLSQTSLSQTDLDSSIKFEVTEVEITELFSAGSEVAFHVHHRGRYLGGLPDTPANGRDVSLYGAGIVTVAGGAVVGARIVRDRSGLQRQLRSV